MPAPPPPFLPTPLPNIGMSSKQPTGYSTTVKIEGHTVAITSASFGSVGDIASKATGGGVVSSNAEGPTKFIALGSLDVCIEGKNVQLLGDQTLNNCGPAGSPPNSATMGGTAQAPGMSSEPPPIDPKCEKIAAEIEKLINSERPPTPPGGFPQGLQGLAKRWAELAENKGNWGPGKKLDNHLNEYRKLQKKLQEQLKKWDENGCDDKGPPLPPLAREYGEQEPVPKGPLTPVPAPVPVPTTPLISPETAKAVGITGGIVTVIIVVTRIIRLFPPLWPLQASPI
jgi:uncharacterized Zn-binding protein involved in type VI secretion